MKKIMKSISLIEISKNWTILTLFISRGTPTTLGHIPLVHPEFADDEAWEEADADEEDALLADADDWANAPAAKQKKIKLANIFESQTFDHMEL